MERMPPQRRPGVYFNRLSTKCSSQNADAESSPLLSDEDSTPKPRQFSFARGRLMETVLAYVRPSQNEHKPRDTMPFQYAPKCSPSSCECEREKKHILCQACGHRFQGRVRTRCPVHPTVIHLMDLEACPNCLATHLKEFSSIKRTN